MLKYFIEKSIIDWKEKSRYIVDKGNHIDIA